MGVAGGRNCACWFVQEAVDEVWPHRNWGAIYLDLGIVEVDPLSEGRDLTVDGDALGPNQIFTDTATAYACLASPAPSGGARRRVNAQAQGRHSRR